jgi:hypothetical protein
MKKYISFKYNFVMGFGPTMFLSGQIWNSKLKPKF